MFTYYAIQYFFCFKPETAYEMRISDWSSDVCSSDLFFPKNLSDGYSVSDRISVHLSGIGDHHDQPIRSVCNWHCRPYCERMEAVIVPMSRVESHCEVSERPHIARIGVNRSEERRVGQECVSTWRYRWAP